MTDLRLATTSPLVKQFPVFAICLVAIMTMARPAHAYLNPETGSMILQLLLGGVAGLIVLMRLYWHKLLSVLRLRKAVPVPTPAHGERSASSTESSESTHAQR